MGTITAVEDKKTAIRHSFHSGQKRRNPRKTRGFRAFHTHRHCIKNDVRIDPACGSGSLLLKAEKVLGHDKVRGGFFGQEINITTYNLCRINMFLHDIGFEKVSIACDDTLTDPQHWDDEPFELIVSIICSSSLSVISDNIEKTYPFAA